jgi:hypothetical protein
LFLSTRGEEPISTLAVTLRFALAAVLAVAALAKLQSFDAFRRTTEALIPVQRAASAVAIGVVAVEAILAALLATGVLASAVAAATFVVFLGFVAVSLWAERREIRVRCNCFGHSDRELGRDSLAMSLPLAVASLAYLALLQNVTPELSGGEWPLAASLGVATVLGARWLLATPELARLVRQRRLIDR